MSGVTARCIRSGGVPEKIMGEVTEETWTTVAAERDGKTLEEEVGKRTVTRRVCFAFRREAAEWLGEQVSAGWRLRFGIASAATFYHGPTDAPGNCWTVTVEREL